MTTNMLYLDPMIKLYEYRKQEEAVFTGHNNPITGLIITIVSKYAIASSLDNPGRIWRIKAQDKL